MLINLAGYLQKVFVHEILESPIKFFYNFKIENFHTYFIDDVSVWVHNYKADNVKIMNLNYAGYHVLSIRKIHLSKKNKMRPTIHFKGLDFGYDYWRIYETERNKQINDKILLQVLTKNYLMYTEKNMFNYMIYLLMLNHLMVNIHLE